MRRATAENKTVLQSGRRDSNPRHQAWKASALPTELLPRNQVLLPKTKIRKPESFTKWWGKDSNLRRLAPADLQSAPVGHLGTPPHHAIIPLTQFAEQRTTAPIPAGTAPSTNPTPASNRRRPRRADGENRTRNLLITNQLLCQLSYVSGQRFCASLEE